MNHQVIIITYLRMRNEIYLYIGKSTRTVGLQFFKPTFSFVFGNQKEPWKKKSKNNDLLSIFIVFIIPKTTEHNKSC